MSTETEKVKQRYRRRLQNGHAATASFADPFTLMADQEKDRALASWLRSAESPAAFADWKYLEIGCGSGGNLLRLLKFGVPAENLIGNDLIPERVKLARQRLPASLQLFEGDAMELPLAAGSVDVVCLFTVFSSLLDDQFQARLADKCWQWLRPGGQILWYDFLYNNPKNPDVRGVPLSRLRELFPDAELVVRRTTLAPPLGRAVTKIHPCLYSVFNVLPWLRTHAVISLRKDGAVAPAKNQFNVSPAA